MKKSDKFLTIFLIIVFVLAVIGICAITFKEDIVIETYSATIDIDSGGNVTVSERFEIDYREKKNERWRDVIVEKNHDNNPLYSDLSYNKYASDKPAIDTESCKVVSVIKDDMDITNKVRIGYSYKDEVDKYGDPIEVPNNRNGESLYIDATNAGGLEGVVVFEYRYTINGMVTSYNDISELNYRLFEYMEGTIKYASVEVNIIKDTTGMNEDLFYSYGHGISNGEIVQAINRDNNDFQYDYLITGKNIKSDDFFEFRILFPNEVVSNINQRNVVNVNMKDKIVDYEYDLYIETRNQHYAAIAINIITIIAVICTGILIIKAYKKYDKEYEAEFDGDYYRELPNSNRTPAEMSYLYYFGRVNDEDVTATMLDLIRKKVFELDTQNESINEKNPNFIIYLNEEKFKSVNLKIHEIKLVKWFINVIGDGKKVSFKEIENYGSSYDNAQRFQKCALEFKKSIKDAYKDENIFDKFSIQGKQKALGLGMILVAFLIVSLFLATLYNVSATVNIVIMFILMVGYYFYIGIIKKRSKAANEEYVKWKAFKNFLMDFSSFEDYPIPGIVVWEEYLVYATSLKIADKVMEQLEVKLPEYEESDTTYMRTYYHGYRYRPYLYIHSFNSTMNNARMNSISTIQAHNIKTSGGSGRGGGFTGGSSFGGGGGGGRSR